MYKWNTFNRFLAHALLTLLAYAFLSPVLADSTFSMPTREEANKVNQNKIGVVFTHEELFHQLVHNMEYELEQNSGLRIVPIMGKNHVQSVLDLLFLQGVDLALVRADAIEYVRRHGDTPGILSVVQSVAKVSEEKIVIIARTDYQSLEDLDGQVIGFGLPGSGEYVTGTIAFDTLGIAPNRITVNNTTAIEKLKTGELAAMVYLLREPDAVQTGDDLKAANTVKNLQLGNDLHILEIPESARLSEIYTPSTLSSTDLPGVIDEGESIATYSVDAVLAVYKWRPTNKRFAQTQRFVNAFIDGIDGLRNDIHQPTWKRVDLKHITPNITTSDMVNTALDLQAAEEARLAELERVAIEEATAKLKAEKIEQLIKQRDALTTLIDTNLSKDDEEELNRMLNEINTFLEEEQ